MPRLHGTQYSRVGITGSKGSKSKSNRVVDRSVQASFCFDDSNNDNDDGDGGDDDDGANHIRRSPKELITTVAQETPAAPHTFSFVSPDLENGNESTPVPPLTTTLISLTVTSACTASTLKCRSRRRKKKRKEQLSKQPPMNTQPENINKTMETTTSTEYIPDSSSPPSSPPNLQKGEGQVIVKSGCMDDAHGDDLCVSLLSTQLKAIITEADSHEVGTKEDNGVSIDAAITSILLLDKSKPENLGCEGIDESKCQIGASSSWIGGGNAHTHAQVDANDDRNDITWMDAVAVASHCELSPQKQQQQKLQKSIDLSASLHIKKQQKLISPFARIAAPVVTGQQNKNQTTATTLTSTTTSQNEDDGCSSPCACCPCALDRKGWQKSSPLSSSDKIFSYPQPHKLLNSTTLQWEARVLHHLFRGLSTVIINQEHQQRSLKLRKRQFPPMIEHLLDEVNVTYTASPTRNAAKKEVPLGHVTLHDVMRLHCQYNQGPLPESTVAWLILAILRIVGELHECNVTHNNLGLDSFCLVRGGSPHQEGVPTEDIDCPEHYNGDESNWYLECIGLGEKSSIVGRRREYIHEDSSSQDIVRPRQEESNCSLDDQKSSACPHWHFEHDLYSIANIICLLLSGGIPLSWRKSSNQGREVQLESKPHIANNRYLRGSMAWNDLLDALLNAPNSFDGAHCIHWDGLHHMRTSHDAANISGRTRTSDISNAKMETTGAVAPASCRARSTYVWSKLSDACRLITSVADPCKGTSTYHTPETVTAFLKSLMEHAPYFRSISSVSSAANFSSTCLGGGEFPLKLVASILHQNIQLGKDDQINLRKKCDKGDPDEATKGVDDTLSEKGIIQKNLIGNIDAKNSAQSCGFAKVGRESQREKEWTLFQNESKNRIDLLAGQLRIVQNERVGLVKCIKELKGSILETKAATKNERRDKENELQEMKNRHKVVLFEIDQHHKTALQKKIDCMKEYYETIQAELKKKGVKNQQLVDALAVMRTEAQRQSILFDNRELTLTRKLEYSNMRLAKLTASQAYAPRRSTTNESITQTLPSTQVIPKVDHQEDRELELIKREQRIHEAERVLQRREKHLEEREQCLLERDDKCRTILLEKDPVPDDLQTKGAGHTRLNTVEERDHYITIRNHNVAKKDCGFEESLKKNKEQGNVKDKKMQSDDTIQEDNRAPNSELLGCTEVNSVSKEQVAASVLQNIHDGSIVAPSKLAHTATTRRRSSEHQVAKNIPGQTLSSMLLQRSPPLPCVNFAYRKPAASGKNSKQNIVILDSSDSECEECDAKTIGIHIPKDPSSAHKNISRKSKELYQAVKLSRDKLFFVQYLAEGTTQRTLHLVQVNFEGRMYIAPKSNTLHHEGRYYVEFLGQCSKDKNLPWDRSRWWTEWHRYKIKSGTVVLLDNRTEFPPQKNPSEKKYLPYFDTLNLDDRAVFLLGPFDFEDPKPAVNRKNTTGRERVPQHVWKNLASVLRSDQATVALPSLSFGSAVTVKDDEKSRRGKRKRC